MAKSSFAKVLVVCSAAFVFAASASAQQSSQSATRTSAAKRKTTAPKKKVWTEDNIGSVSTPADRHEDRQDAEAQVKDASDKQAVAGSQSSGTAQQPKDHPPLLSNPKTVESADNMIAWEDRDIAAQTEFIGQLQQELAAAPSSDKPRLQNLIEQKKQLLEQTKAERQGLVDQRSQLQRKAGGPN